jgi:hypothetical protein
MTLLVLGVVAEAAALQSKRAKRRDDEGGELNPLTVPAPQ